MDGNAGELLARLECWMLCLLYMMDGAAGELLLLGQRENLLFFKKFRKTGTYTVIVKNN